VLNGGTADLRLWAAMSVVVIAFGSVSRTNGAQMAFGDSVISDALLERPGAALQLAQTALAGRDLPLAEMLLEAVADRHPVIADHADLLRMRARVEFGKSDEAIEMIEMWERRESPLDAEFFTLLGRAHAAKGDEAAARIAWAHAAGASHDSDQLAELHTSIAESHGRSGQHELAAGEYLEVWTQYPWTEVDPIAGDALDTLEGRLKTPVRGGREYRERGDSLYRQRLNERALAAYDDALALAGVSTSDHRRAARQRAHTLFRLRRYSEAAAAYAEFSPDDEMEIEMARAHARSGEVPRAVRELKEIGERARSPHAARANLLAGLLAEGEGDDVRAREFYNLVLRGNAGAVAGTVSWRLGWSEYREKRFDEAIDHFDRLVDDEDTESSIRARYWRARAREQLGRVDTRDEYREIARDRPLSYYGFRAASRVGALLPAPAERIETGTTALTERDLARPRILLAAGMHAEARGELHRLYPRARGLADRLNLADLYAEAGDFHRSQRLMVSAYEERLAGMPATEDLEVWWHAWPSPYVEPIRQATGKGAWVEPGLVYAVMREESGYQPEVLSVSGARGLLQIMPETGERLAARESLPRFSVDDLFLPSVNIRLGSAYLRQLMERFDGKISATVASYNAGPEAVSRWFTGNAAEDDEWVEAIPYDQTRNYVKNVLRSLEVYRVLY
jgi:soluble lytic murein transglycosylase